MVLVWNHCLTHFLSCCQPNAWYVGGLFHTRRVQQATHFGLQILPRYPPMDCSFYGIYVGNHVLRRHRRRVVGKTGR